MNTDYLSCFILAAKCLNITEAADRLFISPSTASRQIARLEEEFGLTCFSRQNNTLALTHEGALFLNYAQQVMRDYNAMKMKIRQSQSLGAQHLHIAMLNMSFGHVISEVSQSIRTYFPDADISLSRSYRPTIIEQLSNGSIDILLAFAEAFTGYEEAIQIVPLCHVPFHVVLQVDSPLAEKKELSGRDLSTSTLYMWERERDPQIFDAIINCCTVDGRPPKVFTSSNSRDDILLPVMSGKGVSVFSLGVLHDLPRSLTSRPLVGLSSSFDDRFCALFHKDNRNPLLPSAIEMFTQRFREG